MRTTWLVTGVTTCTTTTYEDVCTDVFTVLIFVLPNGQLGVTITRSVVYVRVVLDVSVETTTEVYQRSKSYYLIGDLFLESGSSAFPLVFTEADSFSHEYVDAVVATFDGTPVATGEEISLSDYGPGTYKLFLQRADGSTHEITVIVLPTHRLTQVDCPEHEGVLPVGLFEFSNDTDQPMRILLEATPTSPSVSAYLPDNLVTVAPGATIQREVRFATNPGHGIPEGGCFSALVDVYDSDDHLTTIEVFSASNATTQGTGDDFRIQTEIDAAGLPSLSTKMAEVGDALSVTVDSPAGTFDGATALVYYDSFVLGSPISRLYPSIPYHLSANAGFLFSAPLAPGGATYTQAIPPGMAGLVVRLQAAVYSSQAANGNFALSDAHDVYVR